MNTSDVLAIIAIVISIIGFFINRHLDSLLYGPKCRITVNSVPKGISIELENVGDRIMQIKSVTYTANSDIKDLSKYTPNLSSLFYSIPCETRSEARLADENLFPNSKHYLLTTTFKSQKELIEAWDIVKNITVKVEYNGILKRKSPTFRSLKIDYDTFCDVIKDENGNIRELKAFMDSSN